MRWLVFELVAEEVCFRWFIYHRSILFSQLFAQAWLVIFLMGHYLIVILSALIIKRILYKILSKINDLGIKLSRIIILHLAHQSFYFLAFFWFKFAVFYIIFYNLLILATFNDILHILSGQQRLKSMKQLIS